MSSDSENEGDSTTKKNAKKRKVEMNTTSEDVIHPSKREIHKLMKNEIKETIEMKSAKERVGFLSFCLEVCVCLIVCSHAHILLLFVRVLTEPCKRGKEKNGGQTGTYNVKFP